MHESESEVTQSCPTLSDPMDCSLPGSSIHGIFQARVLEWGTIAFSEYNTTICKKVSTTGHPAYLTGQLTKIPNGFQLELNTFYGIWFMCLL